MPEIQLIQDWYSMEEVVEVPCIERYIPGMFDVTSCLYVGVRPEGWGRVPSPNTFHQALLQIAERGFVDGLEIWPTYVQRLRGNPPRWLRELTVGDITEIESLWSWFETEDKVVAGRMQYDLVIWWHGPEHSMDVERGLIGIKNCMSIGKRVLVGTPWGQSQNVTDGGFPEDPENPYEAHGWEVTPEDLIALGLNVLKLNARTPDEPNQDEPCGHLVGWKWDGR